MIEKAIVDEIKNEVESSNIRMSSNDDVEYAVEVIDRLIALIEPEVPQKHAKDCPCSYCS